MVVANTGIDLTVKSRRKVKFNLTLDLHSSPSSSSCETSSTCSNNNNEDCNHPTYLDLSSYNSYDLIPTTPGGKPQVKALLSLAR
jgi:hypothetical protein